MRHFFLTRFSIAMPEPYPSRFLDDDWLRHRLELLTTFPLPSLAGQARSVTWLLGVDPSTPGWVRSKLDELRSEVDSMVLVVSGMNDWRTAVEREIAVTDANAITTRLDSDDAVSTDFATRVHAVARPGWAFSFRSGIQLDASSGSTTRLDEISNPFLSFIGVDSRSILTAIPQHHKAATAKNLLVLEGDPAWLQVVHGGNLANFVFRGQRPVPRSRVTRSFPVEWQQVPRGSAFVLMVGFTGYAMRRASRWLRAKLVGLKSFGLRRTPGTEPADE